MEAGFDLVEELTAFFALALSSAVHLHHKQWPWIWVWASLGHPLPRRLERKLQVTFFIVILTLSLEAASLLFPLLCFIFLGSLVIAISALASDAILSPEESESLSLGRPESEPNALSSLNGENKS